MKNKKGNSPLWLAANGGHLAVVEMLYAAGADIDSQDNRKVIWIGAWLDWRGDSDVGWLSTFVNF